jgi:hypothetical protein
MQVYTIAVDDKYIIYRPLKRLAFVGNRAMARLAERLAAGEHLGPSGEIAYPADMPAPALTYLHSIGFLARARD